MRIGQWDFPDELAYDTHHQWVRREEDSWTVGTTHYSADTAGDVLYVELPEVGTRLKAGEPCGSIESGKWVGKLYAPADGVVTAVNGALAEDPRAVNRDPYGAGWLFTFRAEGPGELLEGAAFRRWLDAELARDPLSCAAAEG